MNLLKTLASAIAATTLAATACAAVTTQQLPVIPLPASFTPASAGPDSIAPIAPSSRVIAPEAAKAAAAFSRFFGSQTPDSAEPVDITIALDQANSTPESYTLVIAPGKIDISASDEAGAFYAVMTLRALAEATPGGKIPAGTITDSPRFPYRGAMLDVSRNFRDKEFVKKQIDAMARLKLNTLHFHLVDGAGWRLQIDAYPELTRHAAWRVGNTWKDWCDKGNLYSTEGDPEACGGYYTKDDIREIISYAADRCITVIPEIEMPGHSEETLAAYPRLSCSGTAAKGENDFCAGNDSTFIFINGVLDEVIDLFPSHQIHIGGDEAAKNTWKECPKCQKRMADLGLENVDQLQSRFIGKVGEYLVSKGRSIIGWDEIMEGGLPENVDGAITVMSWRGTEGGERAAELGHPVVMTPGGYCYLDGYQDAPYSQPEAIGGYLPLKKVFAYEPVPASLLSTPGEKLIRGVQGNLFTEYVATDSHAEYMLYPRLYAIAERAWSPATDTLYAPFRRRALRLSELMRAEGYNTFNLATEIGNRPGSDSLSRHLAFGKPVVYREEAWDRYPANGPLTLTDGLHGGWTYNDFRWQAYLGVKPLCMDVVIDMEQPTDITSISADFMQSCGADVWLPAKVTISVSDDGEHFTPLTTIDHKVERTTSVLFQPYGWQGSVNARYIRYQAEVDPDRGGVLFTDEITVR